MVIQMVRATVMKLEYSQTSISTVACPFLLKDEREFSNNRHQAKP